MEKNNLDRFKVGDAVKLNQWCGLITNIWRGDVGGLVYEIQFVKNLFRQQQPDRIDAAIANLEPASPTEFAAEIKAQDKKLRLKINALLGEVRPTRLNKLSKSRRR